MDLNESGCIQGNAPVVGARANFGNLTNVLEEAGIVADRVLMALMPNDAVVPFTGVAENPSFTVQALGGPQNDVQFNQGEIAQNNVWHCNFFEQGDVQKLIRTLHQR
jgi:hypothetical protein